MPYGYLVAMREREHEACRRFVQLPFLSDGLFGSLGLQSSFSWFILQIRKEHLVPSLRGDVDVLAGPLSWSDPGAFDSLLSEERANAPADRHDWWKCYMAALRLAREGGIKWPPSTDHLIGVEAKCARLDPGTAPILTPTLKSTKSSAKQTAKIRGQVDRLLEMGFNHVALLDLIANPPVSGPDGGAWISAVGIAATSAEAMRTMLEQRLQRECEAAHWVWSIGSVAGGDESHRGAGAPIEVRSSRGNSRLGNAVATRLMREEMEQHLEAMLSKFPTPLVFPAIFVDCKVCGTLHGMSWDGAACEATRGTLSKGATNE
jgi:hypothetical protein